jgi:hypothetical protein
LLIVGGALALVRFYQTQSEISLAAGWFLWGLALWDKALALWVLSGLGVACLALLPREIWRVVTWRRTLLSAAALTIGALPLIFYNVHFRLATIRENTVIDTSQLGTKFRYLTRAANGGVLLGFWNEPDELTPAPHAAAGVLEAASAGISSLAGRPSSDGLVIAVAAAILLAPFGGWACVRAVSFFLILMAVAWLQMALNAHTGATVHHTILLWPWPIAVVAVSFGALATRMGRFGIPAVAGVVALLGISCLLVTNEYYTRMVRNGGSPAWSTAVLPLAAWLKQSGAPTVFCSDWGELDTLIVLNRNQPKVRDATGITGDPAAVQWALSDPQNLFVAHTKEAEQIANSWQGFVDAAAKYGRTPQLVATVPDGFGRRIFAVYRFR